MTQDARYVYAVIPRIDKKDFGPIGIGGNRVYTIPYQDICAVVHDCPPEPYQGDEEAVKAMVATHGDVVDAAWEAAGSVLPMSFDVIIRPDEEKSADDNVRKWLEDEYTTFKMRVDEFRDKVELGVQILWDPAAITRRVAEENKEVRKLVTEMAAKSRGLAYFYQHKIAEAVKKEMEAKADQDYRRYYERLRGYAEDTQVNKIKKHPDKQMIMNLSLLVKRDRVEALGEALGEIREEEGVEVRFTGPWPPYTFAAKIVATGGEAERCLEPVEGKQG
ncbi:MAG: GvpL/GvpF family gas vesicle protein [Anaerolineae bacterium]|nr:GvpL/GvpF family gas vesicle protein [Anaerolineae bacterium]